MISPTAAARRTSFFGWPRKNAEASNSRRHRMTRWLTPYWKNRKPSLCHKCSSKKLDLRPLTAEPPDFSELAEDPVTEDLDDLEMRYSVYIPDFSPQEAKAARSECSICALLFACLGLTGQDGWLGYMRCVCILRPRFDRSTNGGKGATLIHKQQVWVEFQPIDGEILLDMVDVEGCKPTGKRRTAVHPTADLRLLRYWLKNCDARHPHPDMPGAVCSRIDIILSSGIFRVISTSTGLVEVLTTLPKFVALSYVWGRDPSPPKNQPLKGGPISDYPPTIRDSINVAKSLGFEWIWVDRVCIDQNSDSEKAKLIPYMKDIYTAAYLTIAAACGENAQSGLSGSQGTPRTVDIPLILGPSVAVLPMRERFEGLLDRALWYERGWTFQEHVYSRRLLCVFDSEMVFACGIHTYRESTGRRPVIENRSPVNRWLYGESAVSHAGRLQARFHGAVAREEELLPEREFLRAVTEYSKRNLTVEADRVSAFAGIILAAMPSVDSDSEHAILKHGHPLRLFEALLTWTDTHPDYELYTTLYAPITMNPYVPSWSWASTSGRLSFPIMSTKVSSGQHCWFQFSQLRNHDILGLPTKHNAMDHLAELPLLDELTEDRSWIQNVTQTVNLSDEERETAAPAFITVVPCPTVHLLTLVFEARIVRVDNYYWPRFILIPSSGSEFTLHFNRRDDFLYLDAMNSWCFRPDANHLFPRKGLAPRHGRTETFAIVSGDSYIRPAQRVQPAGEICYDLYIMLLEPTGRLDTYTRLGINHITGVWKLDLTAETIRRGNPRWQYIHIV
ncbi:heterokaryon incompatibility protein-domain-containing protein [Nemania sp. NC0429]|nr:heterokaryon incompatibility protein-domain-containing protein [Nemania sp. NC0429]